MVQLPTALWRVGPDDPVRTMMSALCGSRGRRIRYRSLCYSLPCDSNIVSVRETATWNWQLCGLCDGDHLLTDRSKERSYAESRWAKSVGLPGTFVPRVGAYAKKTSCHVADEELKVSYADRRQIPGSATCSRPSATNCAHAIISDRRCSNRSVRAYACSVDVPRLCASGASPTAQLTSVRSMHQSLKLLRNPWATAGIPSLRNIAVNTMSDNGFPRKPGNTNSQDPSANSPACRSTSMDLPDNGTRCSRRAFIRSAGTVHFHSFQLISSQVASLTSRLRAAGSTGTQTLTW